MRNLTQDNAVKKIVINRPGGYGRLRIKEFPTPTPQNHEVLIEVSAAGVNFADVFVRLGLYKSGKEFVGWPITPGFEFAGKVIKCGREREIGEQRRLVAEARHRRDLSLIHI